MTLRANEGSPGSPPCAARRTRARRPSASSELPAAASCHVATSMCPDPGRPSAPRVTSCTSRSSLACQRALSCRQRPGWITIPPHDGADHQAPTGPRSRRRWIRSRAPLKTGSRRRRSRAGAGATLPSPAAFPTAGLEISEWPLGYRAAVHVVFRVGSRPRSAWSPLSRRRTSIRVAASTSPVPGGCWEPGSPKGPPGFAREAGRPARPTSALSDLVAAKTAPSTRGGRTISDLASLTSVDKGRADRAGSGCRRGRAPSGERGRWSSPRPRAPARGPAP